MIIDPNLAGHFLSKRQIQLLVDYSRSKNKKEEEYEKLIDELVFINPDAFHTKKTLHSRRFFHCPITSIPFSTCLIK
jgi:hypothetical protein